MRMRIFGLVAASVLAGCATYPAADDFVSCDFRVHTLEPDADLPNRPHAGTRSNNEQKVTRLQDLHADADDCLVETVEQSDGTKLRYYSVLSISGGGQDGAFGAEFLHNWIKRSAVDAAWDAKERFHPCVTTGVSTGAVMGPYTFLASSTNATRARTYNDKLYGDLYRKFDDNAHLPEGSDAPFIPANSFFPRVPISLYDVTQIRALLLNYLDQTTLTDMYGEASEYHRTFLVGAVDVVSGNFEIIDVTDYLKRNHDHLGDRAVRMCVAEAIRASAAIPTVFPPVALQIPNASGKQIKRIYVDGGARHMQFIDSGALQKYIEQSERPVRVYGVINDTLIWNSPGSGAHNIIQYAKASAGAAGSQLYLDSAFMVDRTVKDIAPKSSSGRILPRPIIKWATMLTPSAKTAAQACQDDMNRRGSTKLFDLDYEICLSNLADSLGEWGDLVPIFTIQ